MEFERQAELALTGVNSAGSSPGVLIFTAESLSFILLHDMRASIEPADPAGPLRECLASGLERQTIRMPAIPHKGVLMPERFAPTVSPCGFNALQCPLR